MELIIFDLETTGLSPAANDIIQIAAVRLQFGKVVHTDTFSTFVNPGCRIPSFIVSYTGITDADVRNAPSVGPALEAFSRFVGAGTLVAHNGHRFDMPFIHEACRKRGLRTREVDYADSVHLSRRVWAGQRRHGLDLVVERLGLNTAAHRRHDARGDVGLLAEAVAQMWRRITPDCACLPVPVYKGFLPSVSGS
ncbi:MAG: 3'-5' exonuclease [Verrucomicrobiales bacterium]|nr:3'-5' exonuclease [Verrucomicrobiales bacterium]